MISKLFKREAKKIIAPETILTSLRNTYGAVDRIQNYNRGYSIAVRFYPLPKPTLDEQIKALAIAEGYI